MKRFISLILIIGMICGLAACGKEPTETEAENIVADERQVSIKENNIAVSDEQQLDERKSHILIAYFSVPEDVDTTGMDAVAGASIVVDDNEILGNTEYVADLIQQTIGGDLLRIETTDAYPLDHDQLVDYAAEEQNANARPELTNHIENLQQYDTVLIGYPNWWADLPMPVYTFLEEYDFGEKTIIPFVTHGGSNFSDTVDTISRLLPDAQVSEDGLSLSRNNVASSADTVIAWAEGLGIGEEASLPEENGDTVATAIPDSKNQQILYLWEEGNVPATTVYTENTNGYFDNPNFRPNMTSIPVSEGTDIKGAVFLCAGGAFQFRGNEYDTFPVAEELSKLGYQCFVVDYRLRPYTQEEGALDLARAVRFVRKNADAYGIDEKDIAVMGFSAGGILAGEMLLNFDGTVNGTAIDPEYVPDELDTISADASADGMIYSFYGHLSVASTDVEKFAGSDLPPTYFCYGTLDPFVGEFEECVEALKEAEVPVEVQVLDHTPHGYGANGGWIDEYDIWLENIFSNNYISTTETQTVESILQRIV